MKKICYKLHTKDEFTSFQSNIEKITHQMEPYTTTCERGKAPPFSTLADRFSIFFISILHLAKAFSVNQAILTSKKDF